MSVRQRIHEAAKEAGYPVVREDLVVRLEGDPDALTIVLAMTDDRFVSRDELSARLDDALGMPDAETSLSVLDDATECRPEEGS